MTGVPVGVVALWNAGVGRRGAPIVIRLHHRASSNRRRSDSSTVSSRPAVSDFSAKHSRHAVRSRVVVWLASACRHVCLPPVPIFSPIVLGSCSTLGQTVLPKGLFFLLLLAVWTILPVQLHAFHSLARPRIWWPHSDSWCGSIDGGGGGASNGFIILQLHLPRSHSSFRFVCVRTSRRGTLTRACTVRLASDYHSVHGVWYSVSYWSSPSPIQSDIERLLFSSFHRGHGLGKCRRCACYHGCV